MSQKQPDSNLDNASADVPQTVYPAGTVRDLLASNLVTPPTRRALESRLSLPLDTPPRFFDAVTFALLVAVIVRLMPDTARPTPGEMAHMIDVRLASGETDGWRYDALPPDGEAYQRGLHGLEREAQARYGAGFAELKADAQNVLLDDAQQGRLTEGDWAQLPSARWYEELLAELTEAYFSSPLAQEIIGYVGMADGRGWHEIGLNRRDAWEPLPVKEKIGDGRQETRETKFHVSETDKREEERTDEVASADAPPMRTYERDEEVDAVVIGTGAGGAPLIARLARAGLKVVALEAGSWHDPIRDFATDERAQNYLFWNAERLSAGATPIGFGKNNSGIGVGGTTLHFTAYTPRPHPDDFRLRSDFGVGCDWPLGYNDLEPYFDELEWFLGVSGPTPYAWGPERKRGYPLLPLPLNGAAQLMERACVGLGIRTSPAPNAALSKRYYQEGLGWRPACTNRGFCQAGCSVGAKASMDTTFIPLAVRAGAEIRPDSFVTEIERNASGRITGVIYVRNGKTERQKCRHLFLCAGAIESSRILLLNNLANRSGQVGRNFMAHTGLQLWGQFDEFTRPYKGIPGGLISEDTHRPHDADFAGGYLLQSIGVMPVTYASQLARAQGLRGAELLRSMIGYNHVAGINICGECLPSERNYLELSDEHDGRGLPKPRIHFSAGENEQKIHAHAERTMRTIWDAAGAKEVWSYLRFAHTMGTCRMGTDPETSVVDADCRAHDVPNLTICDHSVFPSAMTVNPSLTIMALSLRAGSRFLESQ